MQAAKAIQTSWVPGQSALAALRRQDAAGMRDCLMASAARLPQEHYHRQAAGLTCSSRHEVVYQDRPELHVLKRLP